MIANKIFGKKLYKVLKMILEIQLQSKELQIKLIQDNQ